MNHTAPQPILTLAEAATKLRLSKTTIGNLLHAGILPGVRLGKKWRIMDAAVDEYIRGGHVQIPSGTDETRPAA